MLDYGAGYYRASEYDPELYTTRQFRDGPAHDLQIPVMREEEEYHYLVPDVNNVYANAGWVRIGRYIMASDGVFYHQGTRTTKPPRYTLTGP